MLYFLNDSTKYTCRRGSLLSSSFNVSQKVTLYFSRFFCPFGNLSRTLLILFPLRSARGELCLFMPPVIGSASGCGSCRFYLGASSVDDFISVCIYYTSSRLPRFPEPSRIYELGSREPEPPSGCLVGEKSPPN